MKILIHTFREGSSYLPGHTNRINSICFNKSEIYQSIFASAGWDNKVCLADLRCNKIAGMLRGPYVIGDTVDFNENILTVASTDKVFIWDIRTFKQLSVNFIEDEINNITSSTIYSMKFNKKKNLIAYGGGNVNQVRVYSMGGGSKDDDSEININKDKFDFNLKLYGASRNLRKPCYTMDFSECGKYLAYSGGDPDIRVVKL